MPFIPHLPHVHQLSNESRASSGSTTRGCRGAAISPLMSRDPRRRRPPSPGQQTQHHPAADQRTYHEKARARADLYMHKLQKHLDADKPEHEGHRRLQVRQLVHRLCDDHVDASQRHDSKEVAREQHERILQQQRSRYGRMADVDRAGLGEIPKSSRLSKCLQYLF